MSQKTSYEDAAAYLHSITGNTVIVTLGEKGAYCIEKDGTSYLIPSIPADHVEDTIGAGDAHAGAIIGCLTNGLSLRDSIAYANQVSRIVVSVKGSSLPPELPSAAPSPQKRPLGCRMALGQIKLLPDIRILYRPFLKFLHHSVQSLPFCGKVCQSTACGLLPVVCHPPRRCPHWKRLPEYTMAE